MIDSIKRHYLNISAKDNATVNGSWQRCRKEFFKVVPKLCVICDNKKKVEAHHKLPRHIRPDLALDHKNLIALCRNCHLRIGHLGSFFTYNKTIKIVAWHIRNYIRDYSQKKENKR